jgi:hypothetical protein
MARFDQDKIIVGECQGSRSQLVAISKAKTENKNSKDLFPPKE